MGKLQWCLNRLKAMNIPEVCWRISQKRIQNSEKKCFGGNTVNVCESVFNPKYEGLIFKADVLKLNFANKHWNKNTDIHLLKGPDNEMWPDVFSYNLDYKQKDHLGDARTNWEKNRHFDWVLLAKAYYVTRDEKFFNELYNKVITWCETNPFLHGISWTSAMEFAIRSINWIYATAFLEKVDAHICQDERHVLLIRLLKNGIINITDYLTMHYSRYSSANNHLLVEAAAIGIAGYVFNNASWQALALNILTEELPKQNYTDGVNKELSLHYQTFGMEAYLLMARVSGETQWNDMLCKESEFVAHSVWKEKAVMEFGDDDEGKILDLQGAEWHQWQWVLQLASLVTGARYSDFEYVCENTYWLFSEEEIESIKQKPIYDAAKSRVFAEGGNSFLRDKENRVMIGIDHAELGFGPIAAHGHADALSFQMMVDGSPVFTDPGTFVYHCWIEERDKFRATVNHNTLCMIAPDGQYKNQSQMLGAFLWGNRAECKLVDYKLNDNVDVLVACHDGYRPNIHQRCFNWNKVNKVLIIEDTLTISVPYVVTFMLGENVKVEFVENDNILLTIPTGKIKMIFKNHDYISIEDVEISIEYGMKKPTKAVRIYAHKTSLLTQIEIKLEK